jgi:hypothetical protein
MIRTVSSLDSVQTTTIKPRRDGNETILGLGMLLVEDLQLREDSRRTALPLACGRSGRRDTRHSGDETAKHDSGETVLSSPPEGARLCSKQTRHRQTGKLPRSSSRIAPVSSTRDGSVREQPSRGCPPKDPATGTADASVYISQASSTIPQCPRCGPKPVSSGAASAPIESSSPASRPSLQLPAAGDLRLLTARASSPSFALSELT